MLKHVSELKPGSRFIWADEKTREFMTVYSPANDLAKILVFHKLVDSGRFCFFVEETSRSECFYYNADSYVYVLDQNTDCLKQEGCLSHSVGCVRCGNRYGQHWGVHCENYEIFMPNQLSAKIDSEDWLSIELGL